MHCLWPAASRWEDARAYWGVWTSPHRSGYRPSAKRQWCVSESARRWCFSLLLRSDAGTVFILVVVDGPWLSQAVLFLIHANPAWGSLCQTIFSKLILCRLWICRCPTLAIHTTCGSWSCRNSLFMITWLKEPIATVGPKIRWPQGQERLVPVCTCGFSHKQSTAAKRPSCTEPVVGVRIATGKLLQWWSSHC